MSTGFDNEEVLGDLDTSGFQTGLEAKQLSSDFRREWEGGAWTMCTTGFGQAELHWLLAVGQASLLASHGLSSHRKV